MKNSIIIIFLLCITCVTQAKILTPQGYWLQISDKTHQPHSIIHIQRTKNVLSGTVIKAFKQNGMVPKKYCSKCKGVNYNKPIIGMKILWGFIQTHSNQWGNGKILDPKSGEIYHCNLTLLQNGKFLKVRGYIGISLFGRTQIWKRIKNK